MESASSPSASTSRVPPKLGEPSNSQVVAKGSPVEIPVKSEHEDEMEKEGNGSPQKEAFARRRSLRVIRRGTVQEKRRMFEASPKAPPVEDGQVIINKRKRHCPPTTSKHETSGPNENKKARLIEEEEEGKAHASLTDNKLSESKEGIENKHDVDKGEDMDLSNDTVTRYTESVAVAVSTPMVATDASSTMNKKVRAQIQQLETEVVVQEKIINQVSKALNICVSNNEFYNSTEYIESERVLLLATQKRRAFIHRIKRLKTNSTSDYVSHSSTPKNIGTISNIVLSTKKDFTTRKLRGSEIYNYVCLIKCQDQVVSTKFVAMSYKETTKEIKFDSVVTLKNLPLNGQIKIDVYGLQTIKESLPHDLKYHIKQKTKPSEKLTPVKLDKKSGPVLSPSVCSVTMPFHSSPSDPVPTCTPKFVLCGSLRVDIMGEQGRRGVLEGTTKNSPLEGSISFDIKITTN